MAKLLYYVQESKKVLWLLSEWTSDSIITIPDVILLLRFSRTRLWADIWEHNRRAQWKGWNRRWKWSKKHRWQYEGANEDMSSCEFSSADLPVFSVGFNRLHWFVDDTGQNTFSSQDESVFLHIVHGQNSTMDWIFPYFIYETLTN